MSDKPKMGCFRKMQVAVAAFHFIFTFGLGTSWIVASARSPQTFEPSDLYPLVGITLITICWLATLLSLVKKRPRRWIPPTFAILAQFIGYATIDHDSLRPLTVAIMMITNVTLLWPLEDTWDEPDSSTPVN